MDLDTFQQLIAETYGERDASRGRAATIAWLAEEVGELAQAVRKGNRAAQAHELGDVLAWVASLANQLDISLVEAVGRYTDAQGCPLCRTRPCTCPP
ncbi:MAG TPA: MazG nucleotide pyrophosphohydrolase domain-containing protein [Acidimicrobiales bacterium]|nr:MazG nucleotide pyrophosphohydrolase domain-containing protein [Acidimicrobiales bacterium]